MPAQRVSRRVQGNLPQRALHHLAEIERGEAWQLAGMAREEGLHRRGGADARRNRRQVGAERAPLERERPAELAFVQVQAAAAGDAAPDFDAVARAVLEPNFVAQHLVQADERGGPKAQEADRLRAPAGAARLDQRLVEGDVFPAAAHTGVDDANWSWHAGIVE